MYRQENGKVKNLIALLLVFWCSSLAVLAQESINASGKSISSNAGSVSYTVGQMVYQTQGEDGFSAEGIQQPYEASSMAVTSDPEIEISAAVYPVVTTGYVTLSIKEKGIADLSYQLYDVLGRLLQTKKITAPKMNIDLHRLASASYLIKVIKKNKAVKTFKVIKNR